MKKARFELETLSRDNFVEQSQKNGCDVTYHTLEDDEEFLDALTQKIVEELEQVFDANTKEEVIEELADLDEILITFKSLVGIEQKDIDTARLKKLAELGGFKKRIYAEHIETPVNSKEYQYYSEKVDQYSNPLNDDE